MEKVKVDVSTGSLFDLSGLTNLTHLDVRSNQLTGALRRDLIRGYSDPRLSV